MVLAGNLWPRNCPAVKGTLWTSIGIGVKFICLAIKNIKVHYGPELELDFVREVD